MYRKLLIAFAAVCLLTYVVAGWAVWKGREWAKLAVAEMEAEGRPWHEVGRQTQSFVVPAGRQLMLENQRGRVTVRPGGREVTVEAVSYVRAKTAAAARHSAKPTSLTGSLVTGNAFKIVVVQPTNDGHSKTDLVVHAPAALPLHVRASAGDVSVTEMEATVLINDTAGNAEVRKCQGPVTVVCSAGNAEVASVRRGVTVSCAAGNVHLRDIRGAIKVECSAGNASLRDLRSDCVQASSSAGNIDINFIEPFQGTLRADARAGNISIAIPQASRCRVRADSDLGQVRNSLPPEVTSGDPPGLIEAYASAGTVEITAAG